MTSHEIFKSTKSLQERSNEARRIKAKYPDRLPIYVEYKFPVNDKKNKFLVPTDLTCGQFMYIIRKRVKLAADEGLFIYVNNRNLVSTLF